MNYAHLLGSDDVVPAGSGWSYLPDDEGSMWDPSIVTRVFDSTAKKTYGAVISLAPIAARVAARAGSVTGTPAKTVSHLAEAVRTAGRRKADEVASAADWQFFRTWFLQAFWDYNGATAEARYRAERLGFWREVKEQWDVVQKAFAEGLSVVASGAGRAVFGMVPTWVWVVAVVAGVLVLGGIALPIVMPLLTHRRG